MIAPQSFRFRPGLPMNRDQASAAASAGPTASAGAAVRFVGEPRAYWRLLVRGAVLLALTLGIYRFWFATDLRRFLWSNTEIAGNTLEYSGTALELVIGFLIAIALLVPVYVGFFVLALNFGPAGQFVSVLGFPVLAFLGHFAVYRARRYRLTRTIYRGLRCHQTGSAWRYAVCALFWWTLILLTFGLAYPFAQARLERYKMRHTYYGDLGGRFEGSGLRLFLRGLPMWLMVVGPLLVVVAVAASIDWGAVIAAGRQAESAVDFAARLEGASSFFALVVIAIAAVGASLVAAALLFPVFQAMVLRWWISGIRFGGLSLRSRLRTGQVYAAYLRFLWYGLLLLLALAALAVVTFLGFGLVSGATGQSELTEIMGAAAAVGLYVAAMLGFSTLYQGTVKLALWRCGMESAEIEGAAVLAHVRAAGTSSSAVGEGLADALNVGGI